MFTLYAYIYITMMMCFMKNSVAITANFCLHDK